MANRIQHRRGLKKDLPTLAVGEIAYTTDTREVFIGTGESCVSFGGSHWYTGTEMSGVVPLKDTYSYSNCPEVKLDDMYFNVASGNVYACTTAGGGSSAKWTYQGCLKGEKGENGRNGDVLCEDLIKILASLMNNEDGTRARFGALTVVNEKVGDIFYVSPAKEWYDNLQSSDGSIDVVLQSKNGDAHGRVEAGEQAIIKIESESKAVILMKG